MNPRAIKSNFSGENQGKSFYSFNRSGFYVQAIFGEKWKSYLLKLKEYKLNFEAKVSLENLIEWENAYQNAESFLSSIVGIEKNSRLKSWKDCLATHKENITNAKEILAELSVFKTLMAQN